MKTKNKTSNLSFLISLGFFLLVLFVGVSLTGNLILAKVLETAIGAPVEVKKFNLDLFASQVGIYGFKIKNPKGFKEPVLASIPEIFIHVDVPAIFKNRVHIWEIRLNLDEITVERNTNGKINLSEIGAVKGSSKPAEKKEAAAPSEPSQPSPAHQKPAKPAAIPETQIDSVALSLGRARYVEYIGGEPSVRTFSLEIRNAVLKNVTDPADITRQIVSRTLRKIGLDAVASQLGIGSGWETQLAQGKETLKQAWDSLREKFQ